MPQFGMLLVLVLIPLEMVSGGVTPQENMPLFVREIMQFAPTSHFISLGKAILFRGAGFDAVWPSFLALTGIGSLLYLLSLRRFRRTISDLA